MTIQETPRAEQARGREQHEPSTRRREEESLATRAPVERSMNGVLRWLALAALAALASRPRLLGKRRGLRATAPRTRPSALAAAALAGATAVALFDRRKGTRGGPLIVERAITIGKSAQELHQMLREPETFWRIMGRIAEVKPASDSRMHWTLRGPRDQRFEWDERVVEDRAGELMSWESLPGAALHNAVSVRFRPAPRDLGTEVTLRLLLDLSRHPLGALAKHLGPIPAGLAGKALHRFKSLAETGEVPTLTRNPAARDGGRDM